MKQVYLNKTDCSGCTACSHMCPEKAITMEPDQEGFLYPVINQDMCSGCGCCTEICSFTHHQNLKNKGSQACFSCISKEETVLKASTSGGAFTALSDSILDQNGVVYGADFDEEFKVYHSRAVTKAERDRQRVSKYAQSNLHQVFHQVEADLNEGRRVLFTGTPCQVAGLKSYLGRDDDHLLTVEVACHGVPSPGLWNDYVQALGNRYGGKVTLVKFRDKVRSWRCYNFTFEIEQKITISIPYVRDPYMALFVQDITLRPSCYSCTARNGRSGSDITLADLWNIAEVCPGLNDDKGPSLVLANTEKGLRFLDGLMMVPVDWQSAIKKNGAFVDSAAVPARRDEFFQGYRSSKDLFKYMKGYVVRPSILKMAYRSVRSLLSTVKRGLTR